MSINATVRVLLSEEHQETVTLVSNLIIENSSNFATILLFKMEILLFFIVMIF